MPELRKSGIDVLGDIPWATHFCNFYETKQDLIDTLVPYFKAGLENNEFCLWIVSKSGQITKEEAKEALEKVVPNFERHLSENHIEIINETEWYLEEDVFNFENVIKEWHIKHKRAIALGYDGMRVSGDTIWLTHKIWRDFLAYEKQLNDSITDLSIIFLCTYPLAKSGAADILEIASNHQFALARRRGKWEIIENIEQKHAKDEIKRLNEELERIKDRLPKPPLFLRYIVAVLSALAALLITLWMRSELGQGYTPIVALFLCAIMFSSWYGGIGPGVLTLTLSLSGFCYFFVSPINAWAIDIKEIPRIIIFILSALLVGFLSVAQRNIAESLRKARDVLNGMVQKLSRANESLQATIIERKKAEDAVRKSEDRIRLIIDTIPTMIWSVLPDGAIDYINQRWLNYSGLSWEQFSKDSMDPIHPEDIPIVKEKWLASITTGKPYKGEMRLRRFDGEYRWFLVRTSPIRDEQGNVVKWYGVSIDIEDSKRAEAELKQSEQRYLSLFENMAEGVAYFQMLFRDGKLEDAIYLEVNTAWEKLTGLKNVVGRKISDVLPGSLDYKSEIFERSVRVAQTCQAERFESYSVYMKKWLSISAYCPKKEQVIVVFDDITERKLAEETLQESYEEIRRLTEHLQKIREEERIYIAREIHDELGQQLTAIKMDIAWIDKKTPEEATEVKRKLKNILTLLDGSNQSVRKILSELRPGILDDQGLLEAIEWLGRQFSEATGVPVKFTTPEKDIKVSEQIATCIFRVCQETFTNITRYAHANNVSILIESTEEKIILIIEDDGIGFDTTPVLNKKSFGILGMKERVLSLGGHFELVSSPGNGTRITVSLSSGK
jgi:PAS domain S-box-containing protein